MKRVREFSTSVFFIVCFVLHLACKSSSPTTSNPSSSAASDTPSPSATPTVSATPTSSITPDVKIASSMNSGGTTVTDYSLPVTYAISICDTEFPIGSAVTVSDSFNGTDFQLQAWGWNGVMPYTAGSPSPGNPMVINYGTSGLAVFQNLSNGCVTLLVAYKDTFWPNSPCQTFIHSDQLSWDVGQSRLAQAETIVVPCVSPVATFTPTMTLSPTWTPTLTITPTPPYGPCSAGSSFSDSAGITNVVNGIGGGGIFVSGPVHLGNASSVTSIDANFYPVAGSQILDFGIYMGAGFPGYLVYDSGPVTIPAITSLQWLTVVNVNPPLLLCPGNYWLAVAGNPAVDISAGACTICYEDIYSSSFTPLFFGSSYSNGYEPAIRLNFTY